MAASKIKSLLSKLLFLVLVLGTLATLIYVIWRLDTSPRTDDAYAYADTISVVPEVSGRIITLPVRDNQAVKRGDLLLQIDPRPFEKELARAQASLVALDRQIETARRLTTAQQYNADSVHAMVERARATVTQTTDTLNRMIPLLEPGYISAEEVDLARSAQKKAEVDLAAAEFQALQATAAVTDVEALLAQRDVVQAEIDLGQLRLEMATVTAPFDGRVAALKTTVGQYASPLKPVFTLIDTEQWYVVANFREIDLHNVKAGVPVTVYLMSDVGQKFRGTVDSIGYGVLPEDGGVVLEGLPRVQRSVNWVRVAQRFPVKIKVENPNPELFRVGASAVVVLNPESAAETARH